MEALRRYEEESRKMQHRLLCDENTLALAKEYASLATKHPISDNNAERISEILYYAQKNGALDFWINEIDHFLDHELMLESGVAVYPIETQNLKEELLKHLNLDSIHTGLIDSLFEDGNITIDVMPSKIQLVQERLKKQGLYLGPVDGVVGARTKEALINFQRKYNLKPSGVIDSTTLIACGAV